MTPVSNNAEDSCIKNHNPTELAVPSPQRDQAVDSNRPDGVDSDREIKGGGHNVEKTDLEKNGDGQNVDSSRTPGAPESERYPEGGLQAWLVTFGSFCGMAAVFGLINSAGVFEAYFKANQLASYSHSQIGWIFSLYLFLVFFVGIQAGPIFDHHGSRALVAGGSIFIVASLMLLSISDEYYQIILSYSVVGGIGGALLNCPSYGAIAHFFNLRRGLATGVASTAGGIGGIVFPILLQFLLGSNGVGFGWSCRTLGFILLALCVLANAFIRSRLSTPFNPDGGRKTNSVWPDFTIFRHRGYALAALGIFFMEWGLFVPLTYIVSYAKAHGQSEENGAILLAILNAGSVVGRFLPGLLADKLGRFNVIIGTIALCVASVIGLWLPARDSEAVLVAFCVIFGFASGSNLGLFPVCIGQFCESKDYGRYFTTAAMVASFGTLSSVPIAGALLGIGGRDGWVALMLFSGLSYALALVCYAAARISETGWKLRVKF
ncbi:related to monocarboxylate transporter 2 [Cephalotrichum gorgonifer]|uniref:Related to monocarboxylate transporter 2 n=1 Tax=Cephalotrichum gorgonifer TaxID=2041049 RepID=A0AAE8N8S3_9PEZI|nr:related to monocarboxylate transporter 2 [Cephalotrichum gorgonifer]